MFDLPPSAKVDRFIPKTKFYEQAQISTVVRDEFTQLIGRITWSYKLAETTLNIPPTNNISEIQIFHIELRQKQIPQKAIGLIDKTVPYPILFVLTHNSDTTYLIQHKIDSSKRYFKTDWNQLPNLSFTGSNLEIIYQRIITSFVTIDNYDNVTDFDQTIELHTQQAQLRKDISVLENKIRNERQFSKKVSLNTDLQKKQSELVKILGM